MISSRPMWRVWNCGRSKNDVTDWSAELADMQISLTEEEKKSKFAKYFYRDSVDPSTENLIACERGNYLPQEEAFMPEDYPKHMNAKHIGEIRSGYCLLENGIGYSVARVPMDGVTDEVMQAFLDDFRPEGDLFYKDWCPNMHVRHFSDMAIENFGTGLEGLTFLAGMTPERFGIYPDMEDFDTELIGIDGGASIMEPLHSPGTNTQYVLEACYYRETPTGRETFIHFWQGMGWKDGKFVRMIPEGESVNIRDVRTLFEHSVWENTQLAELIRCFWKDWKAGYFQK